MSSIPKQTAADARGSVRALGPSEAHWRIEHEPNTLVVDVRDADSTSATGLIPGALNVSLEALHADRRASEEACDPLRADRSRPIIATCEFGPNGARGAMLLKDMGFTEVHYIEGGMHAWIEAGLQTERPLGSRPSGD